MTEVDVAVIGAGAAGQPAGALLAQAGKRVLVVERSPSLGGRGMAVPDEGYKLNVGGHLLEDILGRKLAGFEGSRRYW
jgi:phytoene dehydrogenase-like protein